MDQIQSLLKSTAKLYNNTKPHHIECRNLAVAASLKLLRDAHYIRFGSFAGRPPVEYNVFGVDNVVSRPIRPDIFVSDTGAFAQEYDLLIADLRSGTVDWQSDQTDRANRVVYTAVMSVACCYDLWRRRSRKTPGTFFEILMASLLQQMLPEALLTKHIPLASLLRDAEVAVVDDTEREILEGEGPEEDDASSVSTDLVVGLRGRSGGIVVPLKITTRERIVQPFAHQRILDSAFGRGQYRSLLVCISETQLDDESRSVKQVCVPGTVKLFQKYLAPLTGLYYGDVPQRYAASDVGRIIPVRSIGHFFRDLSSLARN